MEELQAYVSAVAAAIATVADRGGGGQNPQAEQEGDMPKVSAVAATIAPVAKCAGGQNPQAEPEVDSAKYESTETHVQN